MNPLTALDQSQNKRAEGQSASRPLVSIVVPAFNEASILEKNLTKICGYMESIEDQYRWELIVVNDGSTDETGKLAEAWAGCKTNVCILHHRVNFQLGQALRYAFSQCRGDYVVTLDVDLSYSPDHIGLLLEKIRETKAKIVIASPYMRGGRVSNVPWLRKTLSRWANRFLSITSSSTRAHLSTITSMVRVYDGKFLRRLNLKEMGMEVSSEIIYKAMILRARIIEIPAHLNWSFYKAAGVQRRSSIKIFRQILAYLFSGFLFKPFLFFIVPSFFLLLLSLYTLTWVFIHTYEHYQRLLPIVGSWGDRFTEAVLAAYNQAPHAFIVGGITLLLSIQLLSLGILSLQSKRYFEEIFHLGTTIFRQQDERYIPGA